MANIIFGFNKVEATLPGASSEYTFVSKDELKNGKAYNSPANTWEKGQCTWYAWGRMLDVTGISLPRELGNAKEWYDNIPAEYRCELKDKCIVVIGDFYFSDGTYNANGHVMFLEKVDMDKKQVYLSEGNFHDRPNPEDRYNESVKPITWDSANYEFVTGLDYQEEKVNIIKYVDANIYHVLSV